MMEIEYLSQLMDEIRTHYASSDVACYISLKRHNQLRYWRHIARAYHLPPRKLRKCKMRRRAHHIKQARGRYL